MTGRSIRIYLVDDNVFKRIAAHDKDVDKEFWVRCVAVISKDLNLTKGHVRYLESRLIEKGHASGRARLVNGTAPPLPPMPEPDIADMEGFLSHIELVLPVLGFDFLKSKPLIRVIGDVAACNTSPALNTLRAKRRRKHKRLTASLLCSRVQQLWLPPKKIGPSTAAFETV